MKRIIRSLITFALVFSLAFSFSPVSSLAASPRYGTVVKADYGYVSSVMYRGARVKKARFQISSKLVEDTLIDTNDDFVEYAAYEVTITIDRPNMTRNDIVNSVKEMKRKNTNLFDYTAIIIDKDGDPASGIITSGGYNEYLSSPGQKITAKSGGRNYYINNWKKSSVYKYRVLIPKDHEYVYFGVSGLRNGQISKKTRNMYNERRINFYKAGYGSKTRGFTYVKKINE